MRVPCASHHVNTRLSLSSFSSKDTAYEYYIAYEYEDPTKWRLLVQHHKVPPPSLHLPSCLYVHHPPSYHLFTTQHHVASRRPRTLSATQHHTASRSTTQHYAALRSTTQHYAAARNTRSTTQLHPYVTHPTPLSAILLHNSLVHQFWKIFNPHDQNKVTATQGMCRRG